MALPHESNFNQRNKPNEEKIHFHFSSAVPWQPMTTQKQEAVSWQLHQSEVMRNSPAALGLELRDDFLGEPGGDG